MKKLFLIIAIITAGLFTACEETEKVEPIDNGETEETITIEDLVGTWDLESIKTDNKIYHKSEFNDLNKSGLITKINISKSNLQITFHSGSINDIDIEIEENNIYLKYSDEEYYEFEFISNNNNILKIKLIDIVGVSKYDKVYGVYTFQ